MLVWFSICTFLLVGDVGGRQFITQPCGEMSDTTGCITGVVTENICGSTSSYANVVIQGTALGSMTDVNGRFTIEHVPPGIYKVVVMNMGYERKMIEKVSVKSNTLTELDITIKSIGSTKYIKRPDQNAEICRVHDVQMQWVLVPISYGFRILDPKWERAKESFPNAEPTVWSGCTPQEKVKTWVCRCPKCVNIRNERINEIELQSEITSASYTWTELDISGAFSIQIPVEIEEFEMDSDCGEIWMWNSEEYNITAYYGPSVGQPDFSRKNFIYRSREIVSGCYPAIDVFPAEDPNQYVVVGWFWVTPSGSDILVIRTLIKDVDHFNMARDVVRSVVFNRNTEVSN